MKRIVATVSLAALGAASIQSVCGQSALTGGDGAKAWTVSASLRGFYDDNINTANSGKTESFGFSVSPSVGMNFNLEQTDISFVYMFDYKWYDKVIDPLVLGHDEFTHTFNAQLRHNFSERTTFTLGDSFAIGQEPDVLQRDVYGTFQHIFGDNIRNYGSATINHQLTRDLGLELGYNSAFYDYHDEQFVLVTDDASGTLTGVPDNPLTVSRASY
jgi:hypothetical protein